jgi:hypothetical protein
LLFGSIGLCAGKHGLSATSAGSRPFPIFLSVSPLKPFFQSILMTPLILRIYRTISRLLFCVALLLLAFTALAHNKGLPAKNKGKASARMTPTNTVVESFTYTGQIENWTVPVGVYFLTIEARGGEGGTNPLSNYAGGKGAIITGTVPVIPGTTLKILVGQQAPNQNSGGGGSFVTDNSNAPLVIAGGGGGSGTGDDSEQKHGGATTSGGTGAGAGHSDYGGAGGTDGNGGKSDSDTYSSWPSAGGGLLTDGQDGKFVNGGGKAFVNGGAGGENNGIKGGFGGGGVGTDGGGFEYEAGGGGGGYSGGGAAFYYDLTYIGGVGGGGGSYNAGTNPSSLTGVVSGNSGNGLVIFSYTPPCTLFTATLLTDGNLTCNDNTVLLTATGGLEGATYQFSTGTQTSDPTSATASVTTSGVYSVMVTNPGGCSSTATVEVTAEQLSAPTLSANVSPSSPGTFTAIQNTPSLALSISGCEGGTISWQGPNGASGSSTLISLPTSATGTLVYSATCTVGSCTSLPGAATVIISSPSEIGSFDGFIYGADCSTFRGWAWDRNKPNTVQSVQILDGPKVIATIAANEFRQDLKDAGKGNGIHAFRWSIPTELKDGQVHYLSARVSNSSFILKDSPKALICEGGTVPPPTNKQPVPPTMTPLVAQQGVAFTTTLPVFTDPEGITLSYGLVTLPTGLSFTSATRQIQGTPTASGLFVLTYSATDDKGATNSVSFNLTINPTATTPVTGSFEGYLDKVECGTIRGWVWDRNKPNTPVTVEFYTGSTVWGSVVANIYRDDLKNANKGNGAHAYSFTVPAELKDGNTRLIRARVSGSTYDLKDSGKPLWCSPPSPVRLSAESSEGLQVTVLGNPVSDRIEVEVRGAEGQPLHFHLTTTAGSVVHAFQIETAQTIERQTLSVQGQPAGLLLLQVSTPAQNRTMKILKP